MFSFLATSFRSAVWRRNVWLVFRELCVWSPVASKTAKGRTRKPTNMPRAFSDYCCFLPRRSSRTKGHSVCSPLRRVYGQGGHHEHVLLIGTTLLEVQHRNYNGQRVVVIESLPPTRALLSLAGSTPTPDS